MKNNESFTEYKKCAYSPTELQSEAAADPDWGDPWIGKRNSKGKPEELPCMITIHLYL